MNLPNTYTDRNETGCCAVPNFSEWDKKEFMFDNMRFIRMYTRSFLHMPLNMGRVMRLLNEAATKSGKLMPPQQAMILSRDISAWKAEQLYAVTNEVEDVDNITLSGRFLSMVFEGPYQDAKKWYDQLNKFAEIKGYKPKESYFFYTTCPKCAKHYGKNYTIGLAMID
ncbi:MAG: hypothetical protein Q8T08_12960 [Ignavibacteria bacterium]|nr:hypothetical protein [Ignavibacteria bacterium]